MAHLSRIHLVQISAVTKGQDVVLSAVAKIAERVQGLASVNPPRSVGRGLRLLSIVGDRDEIAHRASVQVRNWVDLQQRFQNRLLDITAPRPAADVVVNIEETKRQALTHRPADRG